MLVTVNALPIVTADLKVFVVQFYLQAPADGVWSGDHVTGSTFDAGRSYSGSLYRNLYIYGYERLYELCMQQ
jgi:hypothetical protein